MNNFEPKSLAVFGRLPDLSLAELEALFGSENVKAAQGAALLSADTADVPFKRLGGSVKLAKVLTVLPTNKPAEVFGYLRQNIPKHLNHLEPGGFTLGLSMYNYAVAPQEINRQLLSIKRDIKKTGRPVRIVPNKTADLNSAQVLHNKLTTRGAWELIALLDGSRTILAQTMFVQDIEAYGDRDQVRPKRDARVGMLPPKLAQTMINLTNPPAGGTVLDPFCGTGVLLQESLLMGYSVIGSDIEPRMISYSRQNMDWLKQKYDFSGQVELFAADATKCRWPAFDVLASEVYLGRPFSRYPDPQTLKQNISDVNTILKKFLINAHGQLKDQARVCLAVPVWRTEGGKLTHLPMVDHLTEMGYTYLDFKHVRADRLIYFREGQTVARQIIALRKL